MPIEPSNRSSSGSTTNRPRRSPRARPWLSCSSQPRASASRHGADPGADVDRHPADVVAVELALTRMHAGADLEAQGPHAVLDRAGALDRPGRAVERRQEAVAQGLDLPAAKAAELAPREFVV